MKRLERARAAFQNGQYDMLGSLLLPTLEPIPQLKQRAQRVEARALLGMGLFFEAQAVAGVKKRKMLLDQTRHHFLELLREEPDHKLDARIYPASVIELLEQVRAKHAEELEQIRIRRSGKVTLPGRSRTYYIERAVERRVYWLSYMPFGIGQFQNGHKIKGTLFAVGQGVALALNAFGLIGNLLGVQSYPAGYPADTTNDAFAQALRRKYIQLGAGVAFWSLYAWSVGDALYYYEDERLLHLRTLDRPPDELNAPGPRQQANLPGAGRASVWTVGWSWSF